MNKDQVEGVKKQAKGWVNTSVGKLTRDGDRTAPGDKRAVDPGNPGDTRGRLR
ncbi:MULTISPECIES: hypothetical protein [unclassified Caballeronia]|uniref:hypothetical protein n=1 Tax=unclassified Caballeronia TaxID=2646786 RepID=UPI00285F958D|nr:MULTISPECIES: hypothetical protein [unclassified Caballeronia]MDR5752243.1 hypothetical protein [Caballeronia sp. LZ024]MDR5841760.1 hypothetical protein [Caballeronia sp. LZ031]